MPLAITREKASTFVLIRAHGRASREKQQKEGEVAHGAHPYPTSQSSGPLLEYLRPLWHVMAEKNPLSQTLHDLDLAREGNGEVADRLWERYYERIVPAVRVRLGKKLRSKVETMDVVQGVFLEAVRTAEEREFKSEGHFRAWLNRLVENRIRKDARDWGRQKRDASRERSFFNTSGEERTDIEQDRRRPISIVEEFDDLERMEDALEKLPEDRREIIVMRFFDQLTYAEIGEKIGKSEDATRKMVDRCVQLLAKDMDSE